MRGHSNCFLEEQRPGEADGPGKREEPADDTDSDIEGNDQEWDDAGDSAEWESGSEGDGQLEGGGGEGALRSSRGAATPRAPPNPGAMPEHMRKMSYVDMKNEHTSHVTNGMSKQEKMAILRNWNYKGLIPQTPSTDLPTDLVASSAAAPPVGEADDDPDVFVEIDTIQEYGGPLVHKDPEIEDITLPMSVSEVRSVYR